MTFLKTQHVCHTLYLILILSTIMPVIGAGEIHTVFRDDFNTSGSLFSTPDWQCDYWAKTPGKASCRARKGNAVIYITGASSDRLSTARLIHRGVLKYWFDNIELKVICSDGNGLSSDVGGGTRIWGWYSEGGSRISDALCFFSASPESDSLYQGFWAMSVSNGNITLMEPIIESYLKESHTYTILWKPGNATFLLDGKLVAETNNPPENPMGIYIGIDNRHLHGASSKLEWGYLNLPYTESSIQVDHIHIFMEAQRFQEIPGMFPQALETIHEAESKNIDTRDMEVDYIRAEDAWEKGNPSLAEMYLQRILDNKEEIPEPSLLSLLSSLILLLLLRNLRECLQRGRAETLSS